MPHCTDGSHPELKNLNHSDLEDLFPPLGSLRSVVIVGAGVAGLQTARQFLRLGCAVTVLESNDDVGGVWLRNYFGYGLQVPWKSYQFPDFLWPPHLRPTDSFPPGPAVHAYIRAYAEHFGLMPCIRLGCTMRAMKWHPSNRQWEVAYTETSATKSPQAAGSDAPSKLLADYVVLCTGMYFRPLIPDIKNPGCFRGQQLHSCHFTDPSLARGRRAVVVGAGKTAMDCVSVLKDPRVGGAAEVTLVYRKAHWPMPRSLAGVSVQQLLYNRALPAMLPPYYTAGPLRRGAALLAAPLRRLFWKSLEGVINHKFGMSTSSIVGPKVGLPADLFYGGIVLDRRAHELLANGPVATVNGAISHFVPDGVVLRDGTFHAADLVLYCTGYTKSYDFLDPDLLARLDVQKDGLYLYRNILPHNVPHMAFIGSEVSTYSNILTHGLQSLWLVSALLRAARLPPRAAMAVDVRQQQRWRRDVMPLQRNRGSILMLYMQDYHDQLLQDMGASPRRKLAAACGGGGGGGLVSSCFGECCGAYSAEDYSGFVEQQWGRLDEVVAREAGRQQQTPPAAAAAAAGNGAVVGLEAGSLEYAGKGVEAAGGLCSGAGEQQQQPPPQQQQPQQQQLSSGGGSGPRQVPASVLPPPPTPDLSPPPPTVATGPSIKPVDAASATAAATQQPRSLSAPRRGLSRLASSSMPTAASTSPTSTSPTASASAPACTSATAAAAACFTTSAVPAFPSACSLGSASSVSGGNGGSN